jgi:hypothetical protein
MYSLGTSIVLCRRALEFTNRVGVSCESAIKFDETRTDTIPNGFMCAERKEEDCQFDINFHIAVKYQQMSTIYSYHVAELPPLLPYPQPWMIGVSCASMLAVPFMAAIAVAVSCPVGVLATFVAPFQLRGSGLHVRQTQSFNFVYLEECSSLCQSIIGTLNVSTSPPQVPFTQVSLNYHAWISRIA